jgi:ribosomal protein L7/L12
MATKPLQKPEQDELVETQEAPVSLDAGDVLDEFSDTAIGKVSEIVGESANENGASSKSPVKKQFKKDQSIANKIWGLIRSEEKKPDKIPSPEKQKIAIIKSIKKRTKKLLKEADRVQSQKNFSAYQLEKIVFELRSLQSILSNLIEQTKESLENLYRKYVLGKE